MFHDEYLTAIHSLSNSREVVLDVDSASGPARIRLIGVTAFLANEVRQGNIIFDVEVHTGEEYAEQLRAGKIRPLDALLYNDTATPHYQQIIERVARRELTIFLLSSSYGADIAALCHEFKIDGPNPNAA